ncbi:MAG: sugar phosphate isomerase/epimerase [Armatimonadetes bacterium]|nr:sugar phosphate isomerase/epimerase [Armatimonadota bacterium]
MRLGGPIFESCDGPDAWAAAVRRLGYRAAYCPLANDADDAACAAYAAAARAHDLVIAEVGAWSNPISRDEATRHAALAHCQAALALAERVGARCCVNIAGSLGERWDGPSPEHYSPDFEALVVDSVREIIDAVRPTRTFYTLETMPWVAPDSTDSYERMLHAIDRPAFGVHFDPANLINSHRVFYTNGAMITDFVDRLGAHIRSCHAKDTRVTETWTVHLEECRAGTGQMDYRALLTSLNRLDADTPVMLEHLATAEEYALAAEHVRGVAADLGLGL